MIKTITFNFLLVFTWSITLAQNAEGVKHIETTKKELISSKADTNRVLQYVDKALEILFKGLRIAEKNNLPLETAICLNNAFYAVSVKAAQPGKFLPDKLATAGSAYEPTVAVSTKKIGDRSGSRQVEIRVQDNGNGIPQNTLDKIFQPFFTTKPTGQGTGLGLSLAYDIIKANGGEIKVETREGEGSIFIIALPFSS